MSRKHFTYLQQFGGGAIEDLDSAIAKLNKIIEDLKKINKGKVVTPSTIVVPPSASTELRAQQAALINWKDKTGGNVLHHISSPVALELLLLSVPGLKERINEKNDNGTTPLDIAIINEDLYGEPHLISTLKKYGAKEGKTIAYSRETMVIPPADVYSTRYVPSAGKVPSVEEILSTGKIPDPIEIASVGSLQSLKTMSEESSKKVSESPKSVKQPVSSSEEKLLIAVKKSLFWMAMLKIMGGYFMCNVLDIMEPTDNLSEVLADYYFRWSCDDKILKSPNKYNEMKRKCTSEYGLIIPLILYECGNKDPLYNFIIMSFKNKTIERVSLQKRSGTRIFRYKDLDKKLAESSGEYTFVKLDINYTIPLSDEIKDSGITFAKIFQDQYSDEYSYNMMYLTLKGGITQGLLTSAKLNDIIKVGEQKAPESEEEFEKIDFDEISLKDVIELAKTMSEVWKDAMTEADARRLVSAVLSDLDLK